MKQLLDLCAAEFGITIEYSASVTSARSQELTLRADRSFTSGELWSYMHQVLEAQGNTTVVSRGDRAIYRVVPLADAFGRAGVLQTMPDPMPGYTLRLYQIDSADIQSVTQSLELLDPPLGQKVSVQPGSESLLIGAVTRRHEIIEAYIDEANASAASIELVFIPVVHRDHESVLASVNAFLAGEEGRKPRGRVFLGPRSDLIALSAPASDADRWRSLLGRFDMPAGVETKSYPLPPYGGEESLGLIEQIARDTSPRGSGELWRAIKNEVASTLIITATPGEHARIREVLEQLAAVPPEQRQQTRTYVVKNRNAADLRESLSRMLGVSLGEQPASPPSGDADAVTQPITPRPNDSSSQRTDLILAVDDQLNAIIASGPPRALEQVASLIDQLDIRQPQVLLEVILVSLSEGQSRDLGVELQAQLGSGTLIGLGSLFGLSSVSPSSTSPAVGGTGGSAVILDPGDFSVVIRALDTINDGRSVSSARTLVNNNESAALSNTVQEPFATTVLDDGDSITGFGGSESAGTEITVSPQIAEGDFLVLEYDVSLSAFLGESSEGLPPPSQSTSISSIATIPDGYSIVVGGLELLNQSDSTSKTPLLGDLPVIGGLFQNQSESSSRTRFYLFIRASIMRSPGFERLRYISDVEAAEAGVDTGWPTVQPVIMR